MVGSKVTAVTYDSACPFTFVTGQQYLIYAGNSSGDDEKVDRFTASYCGRTRALGEASEDLRFLRKELKNSSGSRIYGWIRRDHSLNYELPLDQRTPPVTGMGLRITGRDSVYDLTTDSKGEYSLKGVEGGSYLIEFGDKRDEIYVNPRGCSANNYYLGDV